MIWDIALLLGMLVLAIGPLAGMAYLIRKGQSGLAITIASLIGAGFVVMIFAAGRPFGISPVVAMAIAMVLFLPTLLGSAFGLWLGWMMRKRDDRQR